jgi:hypothetical protein
MDHIQELKITWRTLVTYRDLALKHNDFERTTLFSAVIQDIATMIQASGNDLPDLSEVER